MRPRERLLLNGIPKEAIRKELERWSDRLTGWDLFFSATVSVGLTIEFLPDAASFLGIFSHAIFAVLHAHIEPLHEFGGLIVVVGVVGEFCIASRERSLETDLRDESNSAIAETLERATKAESEAAEANLARVRNEKKFKVRTLAEVAYKDLQEALSSYLGARIDIFTFGYSQLSEVMPFAFELMAACRRAGCDCKLWEAESSMKPPLIITGSVLMTTSRESTPEQNDVFFPLANTFALALAKSGIKFTLAPHGFSDSDPIAVTPAPTVSPWNPNDIARFRILIIELSPLDSRFAPA
jgi:hypothetical protein